MPLPLEYEHALHAHTTYCPHSFITHIFPPLDETLTLFVPISFLASLITVCTCRSLLVLLSEDVLPDDDCDCSLVATKLFYHVASFVYHLWKEKMLPQMCKFLLSLIASKAFCQLVLSLLGSVVLPAVCCSLDHQVLILGQPPHGDLASLNSSSQCLYAQLVVLQSVAALAITPVLVVALDFQHHFHCFGFI